MVSGVTPAQLAKYYPCLYHMAEGHAWDGIRRHGLLSTGALIDLFEVAAEERVAILSQQRTQSVVIHHPKHGRAVIRDQKPLSPSKLETRLIDCSFQQWLQMLNSRVFFWLCRERLQTLMCAREYCHDVQVVLVLDTLRLATDYGERITLAPMNTGNTRPFAHPRGLSTLNRMADYPFKERLNRGLYSAVVELAVEGGIPNIMDYMVEAGKMRCSTRDRTAAQSILTIETLYPSGGTFRLVGG